VTHTCHHPRCDVAVSPKMLACRPHWFSLPKPLRDEIWATYRPGQEATKTPSGEYIAAFMACQEFWLAQDAA
jgi:hypothetical protein